LRDLSSARADPANVALVIATPWSSTPLRGRLSTRRRESEAACAIINGHRGGVPFLRDATLEDLEKWGGEMEPSLSEAKHVITEDCAPCRLRGAAQGDMAEVGRQMARRTRATARTSRQCVEAD